MSRRRLAASLVAPVLLVACADGDRQLTLSASTEEPAPSIARGIETRLKSEGFRVTVEVASDTASVVEAIRDGSIDLAIIEEPEQPVAGLATVAPLYPSVLHILRDASRGASSFADLLRGASVYAGPLGGAAHRLLQMLARDFGVRPADFRVLANPWTEKPDVFFIFGGLLPADSVAQLSGYRLFSFGADTGVAGASVADGIVLRHPHLRTFLLPQNLYPPLGDEPVLTLAIRSVLVTRETLDEGLAYELAAALFSHARELSLHYPLVARELNDRLGGDELMLPLHDGTRRYLERDRPGFVERNVDVLALGFTVLITLVSGAIALHRHRLQQRKDRIDVFYAGLLDIRRKIEAAGSDKVSLSALRDEVLSVQREVFRLLIDERIAADTGLVAFVSLSGQMLGELDRRLAQRAAGDGR